MHPDDLIIRQAISQDLQEINRVVEQAVQTWELPERVKRLVLPSYQYSSLDLEHMQMWVATESSDQIIGVAAWEDTNMNPASPEVGAALLLHGLYVSPERHRQGIATRLLKLVEQTAVKHQKTGILVKAHAGAIHFFLANGYRQPTTLDINRDYHNQFWKSLEPTL